MFTKKKKVGKAEVYKEVTDWDAILGFGFFAFIAIAVLSSCGG